MSGQQSSLFLQLLPPHGSHVAGQEVVTDLASMSTFIPLSVMSVRLIWQTPPASGPREQHVAGTLAS
jgi:hypothetical protein